MKRRTRQLSFALMDVCSRTDRPLEQVFDEALDVLNRIGTQPGKAVGQGADAMPPLFRSNWLAKVAIRAVCEAIIAKGALPLPLAVEMHWRGGDGDHELPCALMPEEFRRAAESHGVQPRFLAEVLLRDYAARTPRLLTFRTPYPLDPTVVFRGNSRTDGEEIT